MITVLSSALLPVIHGDLQKTVAAFVAVLQNHCLFDAQTRCSLDLITARPALLSMIARALPANAAEFKSMERASHNMTAAEFLVQSPNATRGAKSSCSVTLTDFLTREQIVALLSELAGAVPPSGRGVFLILFVNSAILRGAFQPVRSRMSLNRPPRENIATVPGYSANSQRSRNPILQPEGRSRNSARRSAGMEEAGRPTRSAARK